MKHDRKLFHWFWMEAWKVIEGFFDRRWSTSWEAKIKRKIELLSILVGIFFLIRQTMKRNLQKILNFIEVFNKKYRNFLRHLFPIQLINSFFIHTQMRNEYFLRIKLKVSDQLALIKWKLFTTRPEKHVKNQSEILIATCFWWLFVREYWGP